MLTDKQKRFCEEYIIDLNATQAAIRAGYSEKTANEIGAQNLAKLSIQAEIAELSKQITERNNITVDRVLQEYARLAFLDTSKLFDNEGRLVPIHQLEEDTRHAISGIDVNTLNSLQTVTKVRLWDKVKALDSLAKYLEMFKDKEQSKSDINIIIDKYRERAEELAQQCQNSISDSDV